MSSARDAMDANEVDKSRFRSMPNISSMSNELVTIRVGDPAVPIPVHKDLLCSVSGYFRSAFEGSFREAEERSIGLDGVTERTFKIFLQWAYGQTQVNHNAHDIFSLKGTSHLPQDAESDEIPFDDYARPPIPRRTFKIDEEWQSRYNGRLLALLHLFIFADKYLVGQLCDDIMTALIGDCHAWRWWPDPDLTNQIVNTAFENLPSESTFNRYLISSWAYLWKPAERTAAVEQTHRSLHPDFLYDVVVFQTRRLKGEMAEFYEAHANSCCFHEHAIFSHEECRERLRNNVYIFAGLIDACKDEAELIESVSSK